MNAQEMSSMLQNESDIKAIRNLIKSLSSKATVIDFEETILLQSVRAKTRLWYKESKLIGFAFVDDYNNLRFEVDTEYSSERLENEIIEWGIICAKKRNAITGLDNTLDASFSAENSWQIALLEKFGFVREDLRSLQYSRSLAEPIVNHPLPKGFSLRPVEGEQEVENLVHLHRAAFGTNNMTVAARLAIMRVLQYERELDLVVIAPSGEPVAFCICGIEEGHERTGYADPIGTHPRYRRIGLGKAIVTTGLLALKKKGADVVELGTSSENLAMQRLAESLGFVLVSEKLWFSKKVT